jgi:hypothetical protein
VTSGESRQTFSHLPGSVLNSVDSPARRSIIDLTRRQEADMNAKLFLQILLTLGCLAGAMGIADVVVGRVVFLTTQGWWRAAIACWVLVIAVRAVYPAQPK